MLRELLVVATALLLAGGALAQVCVQPTPANEIIKSADGTLTLYAQHDERAWTLLEGDPLRVRWRRVFRHDWDTRDWMPSGPRVHDHGWIAGTTWPGEQVLIIAPDDGHTVMTFNLLERFTRAEYARYVDDTVMDSPTLWGGSHALRGFRDVGEDPYYCIRAWWGRRVIVDLKRGAFAEDEGAVHDACVAAEREAVLKTLRDAVQSPPTLDKEHRIWPDFFKVRRAAHLAGLLDLGDALPLLEVIETWDCTNGTGGRGGGPPMLWRDNSLRRYVQLSIRRLGGTPKGLPSFRFPHEEPAAPEGELAAPLLSSSAERAVSAPGVRVGMAGPEVVALVGTPDAMPFNRTYYREDWEYDFDVIEPFTLRVSWKDGKVAEVEIVRPARWKQGIARDEQLLAGDQ